MSKGMTCNQFKQLLDAYLDRELSPTLRLECDTHRLACRECQRWTTMAEAVATTLRDAPEQAPPLRRDFTDRVMTQVGATPTRRNHHSALRLWVVGAAVLQAAAVLVAALLLSGSPLTTPADLNDISATANPRPAFATQRTQGDQRIAVAQPKRAAERAIDERDPVLLTEVIYSGIERQLLKMHTAGRSLTGETAQLAQFLSITLPTDVPLDLECTYATVDPLTGLIRSVDAFVEEPANVESAAGGGSASGAFRL
jgi:hypothetical protein